MESLAHARVLTDSQDRVVGPSSRSKPMPQAAGPCNRSLRREFSSVDPVADEKLARAETSFYPPKRLVQSLTSLVAAMS
jgi:hypothetical protein